MLPYAPRYANPYYYVPMGTTYSSTPYFPRITLDDPKDKTKATKDGEPYYDPYSGFLRGNADVINAEGRFRINPEAAEILRLVRERGQIDPNARLPEEQLKQLLEDSMDMKSKKRLKDKEAPDEADIELLRKLAVRLVGHPICS